MLFKHPSEYPLANLPPWMKFHAGLGLRNFPKNKYSRNLSQKFLNNQRKIKILTFNLHGFKSQSPFVHTINHIKVCIIISEKKIC